MLSGLVLYVSGCSKAEEGGAPSGPAKTDAAAHADKGAAGLAQTKCPVMGADIDKNLYVDHDGKRIYVCCGSCLAAVNADPQKYIKQLEEQGVTLEHTPRKPAPQEGQPEPGEHHQEHKEDAGHRH